MILVLIRHPSEHQDAILAAKELPLGLTVPVEELTTKY
jgi:hypothetical protein